MSIKIPIRFRFLLSRAFRLPAGRLFILLLMIALLANGTVSALTINMTDVGASPMSATQLNAFMQAAARWESIYIDPITVNINIAFEPLDYGILGSTRTARTTHSLSTVRSALIADAVFSTEEAAASSLPTSSIQLTDINGSRTETQITMSTANAKALGLGTGLDTTYPNPPTGVDATIKFSTSYASSFDYDPSDGISAGQQDFVGVAMHEIGHALGFFSVTDVQDNNPGFTLHPNVLDLFRFAETGGSHSLTTSVRKVVNGNAEYYDSFLTNVPLSHGVLDTSDPACNSIGGACQASHWSDDQANLMDPSLAAGFPQDVESDDIQALDYCGYNRPLIMLRPEIIRWIIVRWFWPPLLPELPEWDEGFEDFSPPPPPDTLKVPQNANLVLRAGLNLGYEGGEKRSGLGYATFVENEPIEPRIVTPLEPVKGEEWIEPLGEPAQFIPQNIAELFIQSDFEGIPFSFQNTCGQNGCPLDPTLGKLGGYRIPGFIDGEGDQQAGDVDAVATLVLLVPDERGVPDPQQQNFFMNEEPDEDTNIIVYDPKAIGKILPPVCGDDAHPRPLADISGDCIVNFDDVALVGAEWLACTAPECP